jgi:hypothetical protein
MFLDPRELCGNLNDTLHIACCSANFGAVAMQYSRASCGSLSVWEGEEVSAAFVNVGNRFALVRKRRLVTCPAASMRLPTSPRLA